MDTAYLAGLCAGTSQHNIPSASFSLHVLGLTGCRGAFSMSVMLFEVKRHPYLSDINSTFTQASLCAKMYLKVYLKIILGFSHPN